MHIEDNIIMLCGHRILLNIELIISGNASNLLSSGHLSKNVKN
jgi:hypothetical protein